jgi:hypothetical protein
MATDREASASSRNKVTDANDRRWQPTMRRGGGKLSGNEIAENCSEVRLTRSVMLVPQVEGSARDEAKSAGPDFSSINLMNEFIVGYRITM